MSAILLRRFVRPWESPEQPITGICQKNNRNYAVTLAARGRRDAGKMSGGAATARPFTPNAGPCAGAPVGPGSARRRVQVPGRGEGDAARPEVRAGQVADQGNRLLAGVDLR